MRSNICVFLLCVHILSNNADRPRGYSYGGMVIDHVDSAAESAGGKSVHLWRATVVDLGGWPCLGD